MLTFVSHLALALQQCTQLFAPFREHKCYREKKIDHLLHNFKHSLIPNGDFPYCPTFLFDLQRFSGASSLQTQETPQDVAHSPTDTAAPEPPQTHAKGSSSAPREHRERCS